MNVSSNIYDMHYICELCLTLMTWSFQHTDLFQNEVMPLLHGTHQLFYHKTAPTNRYKTHTMPSDICTCRCENEMIMIGGAIVFQILS